MTIKNINFQGNHGTYKKNIGYISVLSTSGKRYNIRKFRNTLSCDCPSWIYKAGIITGDDGSVQCKHINDVILIGLDVYYL